MGFLDVEDDPQFDPADKVRLFETHAGRDDSARAYARLLLPIAAGVLVLALVLWWLMQPGIGDEIKPAAQSLRDAAYAHMLDREKRTASEMTFYKCNGFVWIAVLAEPRSFPPSLILDDVNKYRLKATPAGKDLWQIETLKFSKENDQPCG